MDMLSKFLEQFFSIGILILIIIFQPEIRRFLLLIGNNTLRGRFRVFERWIKDGNVNVESSDSTHSVVVDAMQAMSKQNTGALIVLTKSDVNQITDTGTKISADLSADLLQNIFFKNAPLHDGAVILKGDKIIAASTILPLSENPDLASDLGLRHRAALGVTENTDMIALIVSEENGKISYAKNGRLFRNVSSDEIKHIIKEYYKN